MTLRLIPLVVLLAATGCSRFGSLPGSLPWSRGAPQTAAAPAPAAPETRAPASAPVPVANARTVEEFDTTTAEERAAATTGTASADERELGRTVASLGDPTEPGLWIETPLADVAGPGRIVDPATGESVRVELRPAAGSGGSRVSLAAFRLLGVSLTDLPELVVYAG